MKEDELKAIFTAADRMSHVCAFVSGRLDFCGYSAKKALSVMSECRELLSEAASSWWKTKGTDEDGIPTRRTISYKDDVFLYGFPWNTRCKNCREGQPTWSDDYEPLFTIRCKECGAHTKPALTPDIARHRWVYDRLIKCGEHV